jgi:hypothetical protein
MIYTDKLENESKCHSWPWGHSGEASDSRGSGSIPGAPFLGENGFFSRTYLFSSVFLGGPLLSNLGCSAAVCQYLLVEPGVAHTQIMFAPSSSSRRACTLHHAHSTVTSSLSPLALPCAPYISLPVACDPPSASLSTISAAFPHFSPLLSISLHLPSHV